MKFATCAALMLGMVTIAACSGPSVIDLAKRANIAECPNQSIGRIVNVYYDKTTWTAYETDTPNEVRITATGDIMYVGSTVNAELEFLYNQETGDASLQTVRFDGVDQPRPFAGALIANMCKEAGS